MTNYKYASNEEIEVRIDISNPDSSIQFRVDGVDGWNELELYNSGDFSASLTPENDALKAVSEIIDPGEMRRAIGCVQL